MKKVLGGLVVLVVLVGAFFVVRAGGAEERAEADAIPLFVPVVVSPSVQPVAGQAVLFKATNITEAPVSVRLMLFNDREGLPMQIEDFTGVAPGTTVSYLYEPPQTGSLTIHGTEVAVPDPVRATFAPLPGDDPGAMRRVVANVQLLQLQPGDAEGAAPALAPPTIVPLQHCNFEPRGFVPYTGGQWVWNCAPDMFDIPNPYE